MSAIDTGLVDPGYAKYLDRDPYYADLSFAFATKKKKSTTKKSSTKTKAGTTPAAGDTSGTTPAPAAGDTTGGDTGGGGGGSTDTGGGGGSGFLGGLFNSICSGGGGYAAATPPAAADPTPAPTPATTDTTGTPTCTGPDPAKKNQYCYTTTGISGKTYTGCDLDCQSAVKRAGALAAAKGDAAGEPGKGSTSGSNICQSTHSGQQYCYTTKGVSGKGYKSCARDCPTAYKAAGQKAAAAGDSAGHTASGSSPGQRAAAQFQSDPSLGGSQYGCPTCTFPAYAYAALHEDPEYPYFDSSIHNIGIAGAVDSRPYRTTPYYAFATKKKTSTKSTKSTKGGTTPAAGDTSGTTPDTTGTTPAAAPTPAAATPPAPSGGGGGGIPFVCDNVQNFTITVAILGILIVILLLKIK